MRETSVARPRRAMRRALCATVGACLVLGPLGFLGAGAASAAGTPPAVSLSAAVTGTSITLTATVTNPVAGGKVLFSLPHWSSSVTGTGPTFTTSLSGMTQGTYTATATYKYKSGTPPTTQTTSATKSFHVGSNGPAIVDTVTTLAVRSPGSTATISSFVAGATVTLVATVKAAGTPGTAVTVGTVEFQVVGGPVIATVALNGASTVRFPKGSWTAGAYTIRATYEGHLTGQTTYGSSHQTASVTCTAPVSTIVNTATSLSLELTSKGTTTPVTTVQAGSIITLVSAVTTTTGKPVTVGTVEFKTASSGSVLGLVTLNGSNTVRLAKGSWLAGTYHLEALYLGDVTGTVHYLGATAAASLTCTGTTTTLVATATSLAISGGSGAVTQFAKTVAVSLTATVTTKTGLAVSKGTVQFKSASGVVIGSAPVSAAGTATITNVGAWPVGSYTVQAQFSGPTYLPSQSSAAIQVLASKSPTTTQLAVAPASAALGELVTLSATVEFQAPSTSVTGTVTFEVTGVVVGSGPLVGGAASVSYTTSKGGALHVVALYGGDVANLGSTSTPVGLTVATVVPTTTTASASNRVVTPNQQVTFGATVAVTSSSGAPATGSPTGTVTFHETSKTGPALTGCAGLALHTGTATCTITGLGGSGSETVVVTYTPMAGSTFEASTGSVTVCVISWECDGNGNGNGHGNGGGNGQGNGNSHAARDDQGGTDGDTDGDDQGHGWWCWQGYRGWHGSQGDGPGSGQTWQTGNNGTQDDTWHQWNGTDDHGDAGFGGQDHGVIVATLGG